MATRVVKLAEFSFEVPTGEFPSLQPDKVPLWQETNSAIFKDGAAQPYPGETILITRQQISPVRGIGEVRQDGNATLYWGDLDQIYKFQNGVVTTEGTLYTGIEDQTATQRATMWSMVNWGKFMLAANGLEKIQVDKDDGAGFNDLLNAPAAEILIRFKDFLIAFNTENGDRLAEWADQSDIEVWDPATDNSAGSLDFRDLDTEIVAASLLGDAIAVYGTNSMHLMRFTATDRQFGQKPQIDGIGAVSKSSVISVGSRNYGFGQSGIWVTDGITHRYIDDPALHDTIYQDINRDQISKVAAAVIESIGLVMFSWPTALSNNNNKAVAIDTKTGAWGRLDTGFTARGSSSVFRETILGSRVGDVLGVDPERLAKGAAGVDNPMTLLADYVLTAGYGEVGYGEFGYGGEVSGIG